MKIWTIANQKGGVGKTTTAVSLAGLLALRRQSTLLVDMDPHGSMTCQFGINPDFSEKGVFELFISGEDTSQAIVKTRFEQLNLLPASSALATLDRSLSDQQGIGHILRKALHGLHEQYSHIIIDCPPQIGILMVNALAACDHLVIPVQTEFLAVQGLSRIEETINMVNKIRHTDIEFTIVPTMYDKRTRASKVSLEMLQKNHENQLWTDLIPIDTQFRDASLEGMPLSHLSMKAKGVVAYGKLLDYLEANSVSSSIDTGKDIQNKIAS